MEIFNMEKLPEYTEDFAMGRIAVIGGGAVGSAVVEAAIKMGIKEILIVDFDPLEAENLSKSSNLYRYPEDIGKNKAVALAERANELLGEDSVHGIDANITMFGPMAFAGYDAILAPLDNYAAKIYVNQLWKQIPENLRPELIFGGTIGENAQSNSLDGAGPCLRCLLSEEWLENPLARTSCTGPQYRNEERSLEIVKTTGLASRNSANYMAEQLRARLLNIKEATNKRIMYKPFPAMELKVVMPMQRKDCPDCRNYHPPIDLIPLKDCDCMNITVRELFGRLSDYFRSDEYEVLLPVIDYAKVTYNGLITDDYCRSCGKEMKDLYRYEFRTRYSDLLCDDCKKIGQKVNDSTRTTKIGTKITVLTKNTCNEKLLNKNMFDLGWSIGSFITVIIRNDECLDIMDQGFKKEFVFYCENDGQLLKNITKVEV